MIIRKGTPEDLKELQHLYINSIREICKNDYSPKQIEVWVSGIKNLKRWNAMLTDQYVLVAQSENTITGFCTLDKGNYIDFFYVHKEFQRRGIAQTLYNAIEKVAREKYQSEITSDVSKTARPFFEKMGFSVLKEQVIIRDDVLLTNFKMIKNLN
ncbi:GNAT family N-acetyltransferase [Robertkochia solimangrovi]|uniref:GNAT family N-acetyltransferase n=1 Tax=Robertkochia solimangrovi TaxID=2213046 RepID=UPI0011803A2D|nr:GNAT family N-acetyltransferase [Robertkochia solimangrovi]TRZ40972.1 GNAT family N-acetyltransferase [Robertkochia solimangrovi]